jgi:tRNA-Thr(GGU) m(6)t(6)A37 methyltransferase TsaA
MKEKRGDHEPRGMVLTPIGIIHSQFTESSGTPIQPRFADSAEGTVEIFDEYVPGLKDLEGFDRIYLLCWFHRARPYRLQLTPYLDTVERGLFATRAPSRPNPIGLSNVRLLGIEGNILRVEELDILDGTPLLDIKPYSPRFDCFEAAKSGWLDNVEEHRVRADGRFQKGADVE